MAEEAKEIQDEGQEEGREAEGLQAAEENQEIQETSPDHDRAVKTGWRPKDDFTGNPDDWVSAKKFNERGDMIGKIRSLESRLNTAEQDFSGRLDQHKKLQEAQMKVAISDLESRRDDAIELADKEKANSIQQRIDDVRAQAVEAPAPVAAPQNDQATLDAWNSNNAWITGDTPKAAYAKMRFNTHQQSGQSTSEAIRLTEAEISSQFPDINPRREQAVTVEGGRSKPGSKPTPKLSWQQLTADEKKWYDVMPGAWKNQDDYLQAVMDERNS